MNYTINKTKIKTIKPNDYRFIITDGLIQAPRAGFEIDQNCPKQYKQIITACIDRGWLIPIANITDRELIFMGLSNE